MSPTAKKPSTTDANNGALTVDDRVAFGRAARAKVPRSSHADLPPSGDRTDPVSLLEQQEGTRVAALVPIRYGRMLASPFAFYRGAAAVMASDLAAAEPSGLVVQLVGDAHLANFGAFASPERALLFDVNDFDETLPGPFEWDVKRLAASFAVAARQREFKGNVRRALVRTVVQEYREAIRRLARLSNLEMWYERLDAARILRQWRKQVTNRDIARFNQAVTRAEHRDSTRALSKLTTRVDGRLRIVSNPPLLVPLEELTGDHAQEDVEQAVGEMVQSYGNSLSDDRRHILNQYRLTAVARKVVGVGSVGTRCWVALMLGRDDDDPLFLQFKQADASVLEPYLGPGKFKHPGQRVVAGQRLVQAASDIFLGWTDTVEPSGERRYYYVRQLWDSKGSADLDNMSPTAMAAYAQMCGSTLARAHARSGDRVAIAAYLGGGDAFDRALANFAESYADQNELDYQGLVDAVEAGRVAAETGI